MTPTRSPLRVAILGLLALSALAGFGCGTRTAMPTSPLARSTSAPAALRLPADRLAAARDVQNRCGDALLGLLGVVGDGVEVGADGAPILKVYATRPGLSVPSELQGVRVEQEVVSGFKPLSLTARYRPLPIGVSTGNANDCVIPGTIGCVLARGKQLYLLSCNHVFARQNQASLGETIVQPSRLDESADCAPSPPSDAVATLADFQPLDFSGGVNTIDAAIAALTLTPSDITTSTLPGFYGTPGATPVDGSVGLAVMKVGRTTELTRGSIKAVDVKIKITYPSGVALFSGVMLTTKDFGAFGDSGSLVVTDDGNRSPLGLLFAGDSQGRGLVCPMAPILARFGATVATN